MMKLLRKWFGKECEYCGIEQEGIELHWITAPKREIAGYAHVWPRAKLIKHENSYAFWINYCPMCGRKL